ncbi:MAG: hypothetical protein H2B03_06615, partial [Nitrosopumilaceae archaeon]|nr:hypothetical protein [Nitrosopumilaceae archaeon]
MGINRAKFVFTITLIPLILSIGIVPSLSFAEKDSETQCRDGMVLVFRTNANDYVCLSQESAEHWETFGIGEIVSDDTEDKSAEESKKQEVSPKTVVSTIEQPNIIIIMPDDVGWYNIGAYHEGIMSGITPNIDQIAE